MYPDGIRRSILKVKKHDIINMWLNFKNIINVYVLQFSCSAHPYNYDYIIIQLRPGYKTTKLNKHFLKKLEKNFMSKKVYE